MEIFSYRFLAILLASVVILRFLAKRKKKGTAIVHAKQIPIRGEKIVTRISKETPLVCLLEEGNIFGENFKDKTPPELPHSEACTCSLTDVIRRSHEWFNEPANSGDIVKTDLGDLERSEYRYYKYMLIAHHRDTDDQTRQDYLDLVSSISVDEDFEVRVRGQIEPLVGDAQDSDA
jgi:hypothetical protein